MYRVVKGYRREAIEKSITAVRSEKWRRFAADAVAARLHLLATVLCRRLLFSAVPFVGIGHQFQLFRFAVSAVPCVAVTLQLLRKTGPKGLTPS